MGLVERLRWLLATGFGLGRAPVAPGTVASLATLPLVAGLYHAGGTRAVALGTAAAIAAGLWSAGAAAERLGRPDPGPVVIDEVAGQMLSLLFLPPTPLMLGVGFLLFRALDIWKPFPARRLEELPGASGIMADDLMVAVYANVLLHVLHGVLAGGGASA